MSHKIRFIIVLSLVLLLSLTATLSGVGAQEGLEPCALPVDEINGQTGVSVSALGLSPGGLGLSPGGLGLSPGGLGLSPGGLGLSPGGLGLSPGGLGLSPGGLGADPGTLGLSPGGLETNTDEQLLALINEILNNLIDYGQFDTHISPIKVGDGFGTQPVAMLIIDDFEDVETELFTHGELVEFVARQLLVAGGLDGIVSLHRVDITEGDDFVVNGPNGIAARVEAKVAELRKPPQAINRFILNNSYGLIPCDDVVQDPFGTDVEISVEEYLQYRNQEQQEQPISGFLECLAYNPDGSFTAHFGYVNTNPYAIVLPYGPNNNLVGGGLSEARLMARTPLYFGIPEDNPAFADKSNPYPNAAFQVVYHDLNKQLVWTHPSGTVVVNKDSPRCGAYAAEVVSYSQGLTKGGAAVVPSRSDASQALGQPENNEHGSAAFTLGFGGNIVLKFAYPQFINPNGPDLDIIESSWGSPTYNNNPEEAEVFISEDGNTFVSVGIAKLDAGLQFELPPGWSSYQYVKIVDTSDPADFTSDSADGYDVDGIIACGVYCAPAHIEPVFECTQYDEDNNIYIAHFGYYNLGTTPAYVPHGAGINEVTGGGLSAAQLSERPPEVFGYPDYVPIEPGRTQYYANSAFQIQYDGSTPLTWTVKSSGVTRSATTDPTKECLNITKIIDTTFGEYLFYFKGLTNAEDIMGDLFSTEGLDDPNLNELLALVQTYLDEAAGTGDFALIPFAAAGNSSPVLGFAPLSPASGKAMIAISGQFGNTGDLISWSHHGNIRTPSAWYEFFDPEIDLWLLSAGTSYGTPYAGAYASAWLTLNDPDACDFIDTTGENIGATPLVDDDPFVYANLTLEDELDCGIPTPPPSICDDLVATIYVENGFIVGGKNDGKRYLKPNGTTNSLLGTDGDDVIVGTELDDKIIGGPGDDIICGFGGDDGANTNGGDDTIDGGTGNDRIRAGNGDDDIDGGAGFDDCKAGAGNNTAINCEDGNIATLHVANLNGNGVPANGKHWEGVVTVIVMDEEGAGAQGVTVTGVWDDGTSQTLFSTSLGAATFTNKVRDNVNSQSFIVTGVSRGNDIFDPEGGVDLDIEVSKP